MSALVYPIDHAKFDPACWFCSMSRVRSCGEVCNTCGCSWTVDEFDEPNRQDDACEGGCDCHTWTLVESRGAERNDNGLEAAWRDVGYADSYQVYLAEGR